MTGKPLTSVRCAKRSHSFADNLARWLQQQQQQTTDEYPDYDAEPGWGAYLDKEAELSSQLHALPNHPADFKEWSSKSDREKVSRHGHHIVNSECKPDPSNTDPASGVAVNQCICGAYKEFCQMKDCVSMFCPEMLHRCELSPNDWLIGGQGLSCTRHPGSIESCGVCGDKLCKEGRGGAKLCDQCLDVSAESSESELDTHGTCVVCGETLFHGQAGDSTMCGACHDMLARNAMW